MNSWPQKGAKGTKGSVKEKDKDELAAKRRKRRKNVKKIMAAKRRKKHKNRV